MFDFEQWLIENGFTQAHYDNGARITFEKSYNPYLCLIGMSDGGSIGVVVLSTIDADADPNLMSTVELPGTELQANALLQVIDSCIEA